MTSPEVLQVTDVHKRFGAVQALNGVSMSVHAGEIVGIAGPNGSGKSTLLDVISGFLKADTGGVWLNGHNITKLPPHAIARLGLRRTFQPVLLGMQMSVGDNLMLALGKGRGLARMFIHPFRFRATERTSRQVAIAKFLDGSLLGRHADRTASLSFGQQKLLDLTCRYASAPALILLDEPLSGISSAFRRGMVAKIRRLRDHGSAVVIVEHQRGILNELASRVVELNGGQIYAALPASSAIK